jgi:hypothetical protein
MAGGRPIDHVVLVVQDLDRAAAVYALKFSPDGSIDAQKADIRRGRRGQHRS